MTFQIGQSGNPEGGRLHDKPFRAAIVRELEKAGRDPVKLDKIAAKLITRAEQGDMTAIGMIADRLEGKAHQATTNETTYRLTVERVERQIGYASRTTARPKKESTGNSTSCLPPGIMCAGPSICVPTCILVVSSKLLVPSLSSVALGISFGKTELKLF